MPDAGPSLVLAALVAGVLAGDRLGPSDGAPLLAGAALVAVSAAVIPTRRCRAALVLGAVLLTGAGLSTRALDGLVHHPLARAVAARADVTADVTLAEDPAGSRFASSGLARIERARRVDGRALDAGHRTVLVDAGGDAGARLGLLDAGDRVRLNGWLAPLEGFDARLRRRHAVARLAVTEVVDLGAPAGLLWRAANPVRATVLRGLGPLGPTERALVAGFLLGDTRDLPPDVLDRFRDAGLSHLLAVSGANVAFVLALAGPGLRRLPRSARLLATLGVLLVFGAMTRWEPSVMRACAMSACAVLAVHTGRPVGALRALAIAVTILVAVDPFLVHSVAFQLSCGATLGIAVMGARVAEALVGPAWLRESLATTIAAQIGVAPVLLAVFGTIPLVAVPANLLAVPLAGPLTTWGLAASAVGGLVAPVAPAATRLLQAPTAVLADAVLGIADASGRVPIAVDAPAAGLVAAVLALAVLARRRRMLRRDALVVPPR